MTRLFKTAGIATLWLFILSILVGIKQAPAQNNTNESFESKFIDVGDVKLQYLDFGGEGLPILFIQALFREASTWKDFAPRFTDNHRVLAISARGVGASGGEWSPVATRAQDILTLLDTLGIERAIFIGNASPARDMTFIAEHHPNRAAGLVYLANAPLVESVVESDSTGAFKKYILGLPYPHHSYSPEYLHSSSHIDVPALTFVSNTGMRGYKNWNDLLLKTAENVTDGKNLDLVPDGKEDWFENPEARAFFERLAEDEELQEQVKISWKVNVVPAARKNEQLFKKAFGDDLQVVHLDVPVVTGYSYMNAPGRIEQPIREFLAEVRARERAQ
jgi:pimeloyl-ACP methyl ester carboxylesterase